MTAPTVSSVPEPVDAPDRTQLWLWMDVESTGLIEDRPAVLECAWMVTTPSLLQLTPLRSRLTGITYPPAVPARSWWPWSGRRPARAARPLTGWPEDLPDVVAAMHAESGLRQEWTAAAERITHITHLDLLISADLDVAGERAGGGDRRVHLAGGGVAQYEARLLPELGSQIPGWCHYRTADTSVAAMVAGLPRYAATITDGLEIELGMSAAAVTNVHRAAADLLASYDIAYRLRGAVCRDST